MSTIPPFRQKAAKLRGVAGESRRKILTSMSGACALRFGSKRFNRGFFNAVHN